MEGHNADCIDYRVVRNGLLEVHNDLVVVHSGPVEVHNGLVEVHIDLVEVHIDLLVVHKSLMMGLLDNHELVFVVLFPNCARDLTVVLSHSMFSPF